VLENVYIINDFFKNMVVHLLIHIA